jgi:hypothetical protein
MTTTWMYKRGESTMRGPLVQQGIGKGTLGDARGTNHLWVMELRPGRGDSIVRIGL